MDPTGNKDLNYPENHKTDENNQSKDGSRGKKYRPSQQQDNDSTNDRAKLANYSIPNGIRSDNSVECNINNNGSSNADPYSVSYNVDSKTNIDKCLTSKIDRGERSNEGYMPWNVHSVEGCGVKINNTQSESLNIVETGHSSGMQNGSSRNLAGSSNYFNINVPSTSGIGNQGENNRNNRKRIRKRDRHVEDDSSSDTGNDDYSAGSDECCIYTYRGGEHLADLPSSFYSLDMGEGVPLPAPPLFAASRQMQPTRNSASSPDMDYLEMDFDPGPSCEADSDRESSCDLDLDDPNSDDNQEVPVDNDIPQNNIEEEPEQQVPVVIKEEKEVVENIVESPVPPLIEDRYSPVASTSGGGVGGMLVMHTQPSGRVVVVRRTCRSWPSWDGSGLHTASGDLVSPGDSAECDLPESLVWPLSTEGEGLAEGGRHNLASTLFHCTMAKRLTVHRTDNFLQDQDTSNVDGTSAERPLVVAKTMVWSEQEACSRQVTQISTSACGATAVINTLLALNQTIEVDRVVSAVATRLRACSAPLPRYLISRSIAGCDHTGIARGLATARVHSRHFATWPERSVPLSHWLAYWIELGAVPIVTINLQSGVIDPSRIPDSWHHQMVFGVSPRGIYLTNPLECVDEGALWHHLTSDSILLVRRKDIVSRWTGDTDLSPFMNVPGDIRWRTMNVLGQVVNTIRESQYCESPTGLQQGGTTHVRIPACYRAGITIAALYGSEAHRRLLTAAELPLLTN